jgi:hypothetical protein
MPPAPTSNTWVSASIAQGQGWLLHVSLVPGRSTWWCGRWKKAPDAAGPQLNAVSQKWPSRLTGVVRLLVPAKCRCRDFNEAGDQRETRTVGKPCSGPSVFGSSLCKPNDLTQVHDGIKKPQWDSIPRFQRIRRSRYVQPITRSSSFDVHLSLIEARRYVDRPEG